MSRPSEILNFWLRHLLQNIMVSPPPILCLGETLWDVLPDGTFLGGAPLNVAAHLTRLNAPAVLVSRVGADTRGRLALEQMRAMNLRTDAVQVDPDVPTGEARATLDSSGSASYVFPQPAAWDRIEADAATLELARSAPAVVFGTLAQRSRSGREATHRILDAARWRVFDANLRSPHDDREVALDSLARANFVKLNEHELLAFARWLSIGAEHEQIQQCLAEQFGTSTLCITRGAEGAFLWHMGQWISQPAYPTQISNTIGSGDSFLAMLLAELFAGSAPTLAMERAARLAAYVASQPGAVPDYEAKSFRR